MGLNNLMDKKLLQELQSRLEKNKCVLEKELQKFAEKDDKLEGNWKTKYPRFGDARKIEEAGDEVEKYENLLSIEYSLETKLENVNSALEKFSQGTYGKCEKCGKEISIERLQACPEASACIACK